MAVFGEKQTIKVRNRATEDHSRLSKPRPFNLDPYFLRR